MNGEERHAAEGRETGGGELAALWENDEMEVHSCPSTPKGCVGSELGKNVPVLCCVKRMWKI